MPTYGPSETPAVANGAHLGRRAAFKQRSPRACLVQNDMQHHYATKSWLYCGTGHSALAYFKAYKPPKAVAQIETTIVLTDPAGTVLSRRKL